MKRRTSRLLKHLLPKLNRWNGGIVIRSAYKDIEFFTEIVLSRNLDPWQKHLFDMVAKIPVTSFAIGMGKSELQGYHGNLLPKDIVFDEAVGLDFAKIYREEVLTEDMRRARGIFISDKIFDNDDQPKT